MRSLHDGALLTERLAPQLPFKRTPSMGFATVAPVRAIIGTPAPPKASGRCREVGGARLTMAVEAYLVDPDALVGTA